MAVVLVTGGYDHKIRFWEATGGACVKVIPHTSSQVNCLSVSPDKCLIAAGGNPQIQLFEVNGVSDVPILTFDGHSGNVTSIGFQKDLKWLYSSSEDNTIKVWDLRQPACIRTFDCLSPVNTVCLHPNQTELIAGDQNGVVKVWDLNLSTPHNHHNMHGSIAAGNVSLREEYIPLPDVPIRSVSVVSALVNSIRVIVLTSPYVPVQIGVRCLNTRRWVTQGTAVHLCSGRNQRGE